MDYLSAYDIPTHVSYSRPRVCPRYYHGWSWCLLVIPLSTKATPQTPLPSMCQNMESFTLHMSEGEGYTGYGTGVAGPTRETSLDVMNQGQSGSRLHLHSIF